MISNFSKIYFASFYALLFSCLVIFSMCSTERISPCDNFDCPNGTCVISIDGEPTCQCNPGFSGERCDSPLDSCLLLGCQNGGICDSTFKSCACPDGFVGPKCEFQDPCLLANCKNNYPCILDEDFIPVCDCGDDDEFFGPDCSTLNPCYQSNCPNNSVCIDGECECKPFYEGDLCEIAMRDKFLGDYVVKTWKRQIQTTIYKADTLNSSALLDNQPLPDDYDCSFTAVADTLQVGSMNLSTLAGAKDNIVSRVITSTNFIITKVSIGDNRTVGTANRAKIDETSNPKKITLDYSIIENQGDTIIITETYFTNLSRK